MTQLEHLGVDGLDFDKLVVTRFDLFSTELYRFLFLNTVKHLFSSYVLIL